MTQLAMTLPSASAVVESGVADGLHIGAQIYVSQHGVPVVDDAVGASGRGGPMTPDTIMLWLSAGKPVAAVAIAQLWEQGRLELDDTVVRFIPEFAEGGKDSITIRHLLTHTGGFRGLDRDWPDAPWDQTILDVCRLPLELGWIPGQRAAYHAITSWFILGEIIRRVDGRPYARYVREAIFEPLDMADSWIGMPAGRYRDYGKRIGVMHDTRQGRCAPLAYDSEAACAACRPGGNARGPIRELGRFYEMLLGGGQRQGTRILSAASVDTLTMRHRTGLMDETFRHIMDWGLGFIVNSNQYGAKTVPYGYGPHASPNAFGHGGAQSSVGFADPAHGLVVAALFNGMPGEPKHNRRIRAFLSALYEDLGLA